MLINIRGSNGSGKSTIVRKILKRFPHKPIYGILGPREPEAYVLDRGKKARPLYVLGPYIGVTGGLDNAGNFDKIIALLEKYAPKGDLLFESAFLSKLKGVVGAYLDKWGKDVVLLYLDTSLEECIASTQKRRDARGDTRPFNPRNLTTIFTGIASSRKRIEGENIVRTMDVSRENCEAVILKLLGEKA